MVHIRYESELGPVLGHLLKLHRIGALTRHLVVDVAVLLLRHLLFLILVCVFVHVTVLLWLHAFVLAGHSLLILGLYPSCLLAYVLLYAHILRFLLEFKGIL